MSRDPVAEGRHRINGITAKPSRPSKPKDVRSIAPSPLTQPVATRETRFRTITPDEYTIDPQRIYIVKKLITPRDVVLLVGHPGAGKSALAPYIAYCVAQGKQVFGRRVRKAPILYVAAEAPHTMPDRMRALRGRYGKAQNFHLVVDKIDLLSSDRAEACIRRIIETARAIGALLVIIDTVAAAFPGLRENEGDQMGHVVHTLRRIAKEVGAAVLAAHHLPKDGDTPRGHGSLNGDVDVVMKISGSGLQGRTVSLSKNRNGLSGDAGMSFRIESVELGTDVDGDLIDAPVAVEDAGPAKVSGRTLTKAQQGWHRDLCDLFGEIEPVKLAPASGCVEVETLTREQVREGLKGKGRFVLQPDGNLTGADRERLRNALNALKDCGRIGMTDKLVWLL